MASKRMVSIEMVSSDAFMDMPPTTQNLYFHLLMQADDDGFVDSPNKVARECSSSKSDLDVLLEKRYILGFESGIILIKHWKIHNTIPKDRYKRTKYVEERSLVTTKDNGSYTECQQNVNKLDTQISEDKESKEEIAEPTTQDNSEDSASMENFEVIYNLYPKKSGKAKALEYYKAWHKGRRLAGFEKSIKLTNRQMYLATKKYVREKKQSDTDLQYYKGFDVFMNKAILDYVEGENG